MTPWWVWLVLVIPFGVLAVWALCVAAKDRRQ